MRETKELKIFLNFIIFLAIILMIVSIGIAIADSKSTENCKDKYLQGLGIPMKDLIKGTTTKVQDFGTEKLIEFSYIRKINGMNLVLEAKVMCK